MHESLKSKRWWGIEKLRGALLKCSTQLNNNRRGRKVNRLGSFVLRWQTRASRTPACSPGKAELPGCWPDCWGLVRQAKTVERMDTECENTTKK